MGKTHNINVPAQRAMADRSHYSVRWRAQETAENPFLESHVWDQEAADGSQGGRCAHCAGNGAGYRQATTPVMGWLLQEKKCFRAKAFSIGNLKRSFAASTLRLGTLIAEETDCFAWLLGHPGHRVKATLLAQCGSRGSLFPQPALWLPLSTTVNKEP